MTREQRQANGRKGGLATKAKFGIDHYIAAGKRGYAATEDRLRELAADPNADPEEVERLMRWFHRRVGNTTVSYRKMYRRDRAEAVRGGADVQMAHDVAARKTRETWQGRMALVGGGR